MNSLPRPLQAIVITVCIIVLGLGGVVVAFFSEIVHAIQVGVDIADRSSKEQQTPTAPGATLAPLFHYLTSYRFL